MTEYIIHASEISKRFGNKLALDNFSVNIAQGGVHALIGSNGAGKSTLFRVLLGFLTPESGSSQLLGQESKSLTPETRARIGYVNEEHTLPEWLKVNQLLKMQLSYYPQWNESIFQQVIRNFDVSGTQKVGSLSRGERAGFNLALALAQNPELLILDEPTLGLDVVAKQEFLNSILFCIELDTTVIYCSHQMDEVERLADKLLIIEDGSLVVDSNAEDFSQRVQSWITDGKFKSVIEERVTGLLGGRLIDEKYQFEVIDSSETFASELALLGIPDPVCIEVDMASAVRAFLTRSHAGSLQ